MPGTCYLPVTGVRYARVMRIPLLSLHALVALVLAAGAALADELELRTGDVLVGDVRTEGQQVYLRHPTLGEMTFPRSAVRAIRLSYPAAPAPATRPPPPPPPPPPGGVYVRQGLRPPPPPCPPPATAVAPCEPCPPCPPCEPCEWEGPWSLSLGLSWTQAGGNSDSLSFKVELELTYEEDPWKWVTSAFYAYTESGRTVETDRFFLESKLDRKLTARSYLFVSGSYDTDEPADLDYRVIPTAGYGVTILKGPSHELRGEVGGGVTIEKRTNAPEAVDPSAYLGLDFEKEWENGGKLVLEYDFFPNLDDFDLSLTRFDAKYELPLSKCLNLRLGLRLDWQIDPADPDVEPLDWIASAGLAVNF